MKLAAYNRLRFLTEKQGKQLLFLLMHSFFTEFHEFGIQIHIFALQT